MALCLAAGGWFFSPLPRIVKCELCLGGLVRSAPASAVRRRQPFGGGGGLTFRVNSRKIRQKTVPHPTGFPSVARSDMRELPFPSPPARFFLV